MARAETAEELIFEKPPYLTAAKAITAGDVATLEKLIAAGLDVNYEGRETETPWAKDTVTLLVWASLQEKPGCVEALLRAGADPNKGTRLGLTPLIDAAMGKSDEVFELLLVRYKADPNKIFNSGVARAALTFALMETPLGEKRWQRAEMLVQHGADVNLNLDRGETAVILATVLGHWRAVLWLLEHGADYEARDSINATMMCYQRNSYKTHTLLPPEAHDYRDKVRDWLLARGVVRSRIDPALHPGHECDD